MLERKLASSDVSEEEQVNILKELERKETEYMRLKRHKICVDDFDLLTIIGRGPLERLEMWIFYKLHTSFIVKIFVIIFFNIVAVPNY